MFGRLPLIHRVGMAAAAVVVCAALGLWLGAQPQVPVMATPAITVGLLVGAGLAWLLVHESRSTRPRAQRVRNSPPR